MEKIMMSDQITKNLTHSLPDRTLQLARILLYYENKSNLGKNNIIILSTLTKVQFMKVSLSSSNSWNFVQSANSSKMIMSLAHFFFLRKKENWIICLKNDQQNFGNI